MAKRIKYMMSEQQLSKLLDACLPIPYMVVCGVLPYAHEGIASAVWRDLGWELGFKWETVQPIPGACQRCFTAEPLEEAATVP